MLATNLSIMCQALQVFHDTFSVVFRYICKHKSLKQPHENAGHVLRIVQRYKSAFRNLLTYVFSYKIDSCDMFSSRLYMFS